MNSTERTPADAHLDAALQRLPQWQPPADFAARLAAAAARQNEALLRMGSPLSPGMRRAGTLLALLTDVTICTLLTGAAAAVLALLPWQALVDHPQVVTVIAVGAIGVAAAATCVRLLRSSKH